jgi:hypothetical protein
VGIGFGEIPNGAAIGIFGPPAVLVATNTASCDRTFGFGVNLPFSNDANSVSGFASTGTLMMSFSLDDS